MRACRCPTAASVLLAFILPVSSAGCDAGIEVKGEVRDESGSAIDGASVTLSYAPGSGNDESDRTTSKDGGRFATSITFGSGSHPTFVLRVEEEGFEPYEKRYTRDAKTTVVLRRTAQAKGTELKKAQPTPTTKGEGTPGLEPAPRVKNEPTVVQPK